MAPWKGDKRYTALSKRAAQLKKAGNNAEQIVATLSAEFGPPATPAGLRDEAPQAYKDIEQVMQIQVAAGLVKPLARMRPIAVIMAGDADN
jgi:tRNA-splicing ligase RtcB